MKIIEFVPQLNSGGGERFVVDLCNTLTKRHKVVLVVLHPIEKCNFYLNDLSDKVSIISLNKKKGIDIGLFVRVCKLIRRERPDIVHTHLRAILYIALALVSYKKPKYFHTVHNDAKKEAGDKISTLLRKYLFKTHKVTPVTISNESLLSFRSFYKMDAPMINNGRDVPSDLTVSQDVKKEFVRYRKTPKTKVLINLARIDPVKRQTMLAKIVNQLTKEEYDFSMLIVGSTKKRELVDEIQSYNCPNLYILGERKNPLEYLKMCDAYCLCSSYEGMPISFIEAMGTGCIPVCTPVGGIVDVIKNGKNGFLSDSLEEIDYKNILKRFLELTDFEIEAIRKEVLKSYLPYSMQECAKNYESLFQSKL